MSKKLALVAIVLAWVAIQCYLLYALQHGASEQFTAVWHSFGVAQTEYSAFVFQTVRYWWLLPVVCAVLVGYSLWRRSRPAALVAVGLATGGAFALIWAMYAPALMVAPL